jgi:hypothetical protein
MRTELSDGEVTIRAYMRGVAIQILEAARESLAEVGPAGLGGEVPLRCFARLVDLWKDHLQLGPKLARQVAYFPL